MSLLNCYLLFFSGGVGAGGSHRGPAAVERAAVRRRHGAGSECTERMWRLLAASWRAASQKTTLLVQLSVVGEVQTVEIF